MPADGLVLDYWQISDCIICKCMNPAFQVKWYEIIMCNMCISFCLCNWTQLSHYYHMIFFIVRASIWSCLCSSCSTESLASVSMMSSNGNIFHLTGPLCGEFTGHQWIPHTKAVTQSFDVVFDLRLNKCLSKQSWGWWFEMPSRSLWCNCNVFGSFLKLPSKQSHKLVITTHLYHKSTWWELILKKYVKKALPILSETPSGWLCPL